MIKIYVTLLFPVLLLGGCGASSGPETLEGSRPNIILVMTDDQGYPNLSCVGHPELKTPRVPAFWYWKGKLKAEWYDRFLFFHKGRWPKGEDPELYRCNSCGIRSQRFRLVNNTELYDIENDTGIPQWQEPEL